MLGHRSTGGWKIWITYYNQHGQPVGYGVHPHAYSRQDAAVRKAKQLSRDNDRMTWIVSQVNPREDWWK